MAILKWRSKETDVHVIARRRAYLIRGLEGLSSDHISPHDKDYAKEHKLYCFGRAVQALIAMVCNSNNVHTSMGIVIDNTHLEEEQLDLAMNMFEVSPVSPALCLS